MSECITDSLEYSTSCVSVLVRVCVCVREREGEESNGDEFFGVECSSTRA